ncbi:MAG: hypothetical protein GY754_38550 [bacterium]|nr:hypothetical protein [bacterium]
MTTKFNIQMTALLTAVVLTFIGCEAGLSQSGSSEDDDGFSFSEMYATIATLQSNNSTLDSNIATVQSSIDTEVTQLQEQITALAKRISPTGTINPFAGSTDKVPDQWLLCDGRAVSRSDYSTLYDVVGTSWGTGDGSTTFNLPDLRGRFLRGVSDGSGVDPDADSRTNSYGGNTGDAVGTYQDHAYEEHSHNYWDIYLSEFGATAIITSFGSAGGVDNDNGQHQVHRTSDSSGNSETRPTNAAVNYIIKY